MRGLVVFIELVKEELEAEPERTCEQEAGYLVHWTASVSTIQVQIRAEFKHIIEDEDSEGVGREVTEREKCITEQRESSDHCRDDPGFEIIEQRRAHAPFEENSYKKEDVNSSEGDKSLRTEADLGKMEMVIFETEPAELGATLSALDVGTPSIFINNSLAERTGLPCDHLVEIGHGLVAEFNQEAFLLVALVAFGNPLRTALLALEWEFAILLGIRNKAMVATARTFEQVVSVHQIAFEEQGLDFSTSSGREYS